VGIAASISEMHNTIEEFCCSGVRKCSCAMTGSLNENNTEKKKDLKRAQD